MKFSFREFRLEVKASTSKKSIPYYKILTSVPLWSINVAFFNMGIMHAFFTNVFSKYLMDNFELSVQKVRQLTSLPTLGEFFLYLLSAFVADYYITKGRSPTTVRKTISATSQVLPGICCLLLTRVV